MKIAKLVVGSSSVLIFGIGIAMALVNGLATGEVFLNAQAIRAGALPLAFSAAFTGAGLASMVRRHRPGGDVTVALFYELTALIGLAAWMAGGNLAVWAVPLLTWALLAGLLGVAFVLPAGTLRVR